MSRVYMLTYEAATYGKERLTPPIWTPPVVQV